MTNGIKVETVPAEFKPYFETADFLGDRSGSVDSPDEFETVASMCATAQQNCSDLDAYVKSQGAEPVIKKAAASSRPIEKQNSDQLVVIGGKKFLFKRDTLRRYEASSGVLDQYFAYENGDPKYVWAGVLSSPQKIGGLDLKAGTEVQIYDNGVLAVAVFPKGDQFKIDDFKHSFGNRSREIWQKLVDLGYLLKDGRVVREVVDRKGFKEFGEEDMYRISSVFDGPSLLTHNGNTYFKGAVFHRNGRPAYRVVTSPSRLFGMDLKPGDSYIKDRNGRVKFLKFHGGNSARRNGIWYNLYMYFYPNGALQHGHLTKDTLMANGILCAAYSFIGYHPDGSLMCCTSAKKQKAGGKTVNEADLIHLDPKGRFGDEEMVKNSQCAPWLPPSVMPEFTGK